MSRGGVVFERGLLAYWPLVVTATAKESSKIPACDNVAVRDSRLGMISSK